MKLLLIEDEELDFQIMKRITSKKMNNVKLDRALSISKGLEFIKNNEYDAIITDLRLPDSEYDVQVIEEIRKITTVPIMVYSGSYLDETLIKTIKAGASRYMTKGTIGMLRDIPDNIINMIKESQKILKIEKLNNELRGRNYYTS
jgi:DNA-binding response OmpR family regulator